MKSNPSTGSAAELAAKLRDLVEFSNVTPDGKDHYHIRAKYAECAGGDIIMEIIAALEAHSDGSALAALKETRFLLGGWIEALDSNWVHATSIEGQKRLHLTREEMADYRNRIIAALEATAQKSPERSESA